jgi:TldD protein
MIDELQKTVTLAQKFGSEFTDARFETQKAKQINVVNGAIRTFSSIERSGVAIRVKFRGTWGLASTTTLTSDALKTAARNAFKLAKTANTYSKEKIGINETASLKKKSTAKIKIDPENIDTEEKLKFVFSLDEAQKAADKRIVSRTSNYVESLKNFELVNSFDSQLDWNEIRTSFSAMSIALESGKREMGFDNMGGTVGYELVKETDPYVFGTKVATEAVKLLSAVRPPSGLMTVIVDPDIAGVLAHEVMGHASEADEVIKHRSFLSDAVGKKVASNLVTMVDNGTITGAYGSIPFDSEGTPSSRTVIIEKGVYKGFMHSMETAAALNSAPTGNGRTQDYNKRLWVRMTNTFFEPGNWKLEEIISDTKEGLLALKAISGMEDPVGGGFQVRVLKGYTIKNGERKNLVRGFSLTGKALDILKTVDSVGKEFELSAGFCGKGEEDWVQVTTGGPYMRAKIIAGGE